MSLMIVLSIRLRSLALIPNHSWMQQLPWRCAIAATGTDSHVAASKCVAISRATASKPCREARRIAHSHRRWVLAGRRRETALAALSRKMVTRQQSNETPQFIPYAVSRAGETPSVIRAASLHRGLQAGIGYLARRGDGLQPQLGNINNRCKQRGLQRIAAEIRPT